MQRGFVLPMTWLGVMKERYKSSLYWKVSSDPWGDFGYWMMKHLTEACRNDAFRFNQEPRTFRKVKVIGVCAIPGDDFVVQYTVPQ